MKQDCRHSTSDGVGVQLWCIPQIDTSTWFPLNLAMRFPAAHTSTGRTHIIKDFHLQAVKHARHTKKMPGLCRAFGESEVELMCRPSAV
jgi:hypothetical protein